MDIVSHAVAGACTGAAWGRPVTGAVLATLPDLVLGWRRRALPPPAYDFTHSFLFIVAMAMIGDWFFGGWGWMIYFCLLSHLFLDIPTHGSQWAPPLLWPLEWRCTIFGLEWEWFAPVWWFGLVLTFIWSSLWLFAAYTRIGFHV